MFSVIMDGSLFIEGTWNSSATTISIDDLAWGTHNFTIVLSVEAGLITMQDTVLVVVQDTTSPTITGISEVTIEMETDYVINWFPFDRNPDIYEIYYNGNFYTWGEWSGTSLTVMARCLALGIHNYTLVVYDQSDNWASYTTYITTTAPPPAIDSPPDVIYGEGTTGHTIIWDAKDSSPLNYTITKEQSVIFTSDWQGESISINVDGLEEGVYTYTVIVYNTHGAFSEDSVLVSVIPNNSSSSVSSTNTISTISSSSSSHSTFTSNGFEILLVIISCLSFSLYSWRKRRNSS